MADEIDEKNEPEKKGGLVKKLMIGLILIAVLGGGGGAAGFYLAGSVNTDNHEAEDPNQPKLVVRDGEAPAVVEKPTAGKASKPKFNEAAFKATYYPIEKPFTSNLRESSRFAQMSLAIATYYDERVLENIQEHETAIRSAVLMTLAEQDAETLGTQQGKQTLQGLLTTAINKVLEEKSGFGGIDNVYFTSFVVQ